MHTRNTNWASAARDALSVNKIFKLSTRDALNEKQIAGRHFYLIYGDVTISTISIKEPQSGLHSFHTLVVIFFFLLHTYYFVLYLRSVAFFGFCIFLSCTFILSDFFFFFLHTW